MPTIRLQMESRSISKPRPESDYRSTPFIRTYPSSSSLAKISFLQKEPVLRAYLLIRFITGIRLEAETRQTSRENLQALSPIRSVILCSCRFSEQYQNMSSIVLETNVPMPLKILVVDDQELVRRTLRSILAQQPHWKIFEASNGRVAVDSLPAIQPDVVVMDLVMPEMNGIEAAYGFSGNASTRDPGLNHGR
jgi:hypothetical protein